MNIILLEGMKDNKFCSYKLQNKDVISLLSDWSATIIAQQYLERLFVNSLCTLFT